MSSHFQDEASSKALQLVRSAQRFVLVGHVQPDGDCAGSQAALAAALESLGKQVWIINPDPLQHQFDDLARGRKFGVWTGGSLPVHDVTVALDFSEFSRCGPLAEPLAAASSRKLVVDHHPTAGEAWWDEAYMDVGAASTGLLVYRMAQALGARLDATGALGVFTSLVTDTGWFRYSNTDAESLRVAAQMVDLGVDPARVHGALFQRSSRERPLGIGRALARLGYYADGRLAVVDLPKPVDGEFELTDGDEVLDLMRSVERVEVALFLRETQNGQVRLSARSKGDFDVNRLARRFGGGGHVRASGASLPGPLALAREAMVTAALAQLEDPEVSE